MGCILPTLLRVLKQGCSHCWACWPSRVSIDLTALGRMVSETGLSHWVGKQSKQAYCIGGKEGQPQQERMHVLPTWHTASWEQGLQCNRTIYSLKHHTVLCCELDQQVLELKATWVDSTLIQGQLKGVKTTRKLLGLLLVVPLYSVHTRPQVRCMAVALRTTLESLTSYRA